MVAVVLRGQGDPVGWEQTKYFDPKELIKLNYTGMTTTGEMSGTQVRTPSRLSSSHALRTFEPTKFMDLCRR